MESSCKAKSLTGRQLFRQRWALARRMRLPRMFERSFAAPTIAEFWRRWNPLFHIFGLAFIYLPLRRWRVPRPLAVLATFLAIGYAHNVVAAIVSLTPPLVCGRPALFSLTLFALFGLTTVLSQARERAVHTIKTRPRPMWAYACKNSAYLLACLLLAVLLVRSPRPGPAAPTPAPPAVRLDTTGARDLIAFCRAQSLRQPWDEAAIRRLVSSPPYLALLAHHGSLDAGFSSEALASMLLALRDGRPFASESARLTRMYHTYRWALGQVPTLEARLERLADPALVLRAAEQAQAALPPGTRLVATVYVLADGASPAYATEDSVVLDLLQIDKPDRVDQWLAHELHHIGASTLLPEPCADPALGIALDTVAGLVQEGSATYWIDGWHASPTPADYGQVQAFLLDVIGRELSADETEARLAALLGYERGPLYRVGNAMIATLAATHGDAWVQARLSDPVGLLRAYHHTGGWSSSAEVLALLDKGRGACPRWFKARWWEAITRGG